MLDKLSHIKSNLYRAASDLSQYKIKGFKPPEKEKGDKLKTSSASEYLMKLNWMLKELIIEKDSVYVNFMVNDLHFKTSLNKKKFDGELFYEVSALIPRENQKFLKAVVKFKYGGENLSQEINNNGLRILMNRLFSLNIHNELTDQDSRVLNEIFNNIEGKVAGYLNYITYHLLVFINIVAGINLNSGLNCSNEQVHLIKIRITGDL